MTNNFIGRDRELEVLGNIYSEAGTAGIFLSGRNGIGKTELLRQAFHRLFNHQNAAVPFFYTVKTALASIEYFSRDYLCSFIVQSIAFEKKNISMTDACVYSLEDAIRLAGDSGIKWIAGVVDNYEQAKKAGDPLNLFLFAVSAPYQSYLITGVPVIVLLDDFHKMKRFCEINAVGSNKDFWTLFEVPVKSRHTPHVFTGNQSELNRMFFQDTLFGEYLELFNLSGLGREDSVKYFTMLAGTYSLDVRLELRDFLDLFGGSPYYLRNFVQAARQSSATLTEDNFRMIYLGEITKGKTFKYWSSLLKTYIPRPDLRAPSLRLLYGLCSETSSVVLPNFPDAPAAGSEETERIINLLETSGAVETGFTEYGIADDRIMIDVIRALYLKEIAKEPWSRIKEVITGDNRKDVKTAASPSFTLTVPAATKAEFVAVKTIEHIARNFNISPAITGQLQLALADLFANVVDVSCREGGNYSLKFELKDNVFLIEITVPSANIVLSDNDRHRIGAYLDDLSVEGSSDCTKITFLKEVSGDFVPAS
ncbi:MAG: hypothetical protein HZA16_02310 [Nitrospirae bacterium]|nr:hypothetical protein [Nitrospirota bacterium]